MENKPCSCESLNAIKIAELDKRLSIHIDYQLKAVEKADIELRNRLEGMNEFRLQLREEAALFMPRKEYQVRHDALEARLMNLEASSNNLSGKFWAMIAVATVIGGMIGHFIGQFIGRGQ